MKTGDLTIVLDPTYHRPYGQQGYTSFPEEYGFHRSVYVLPDTIGIVLEKKNKYCRVLFTDREVWLEEDKMAVMRCI